MRLRLRPQTAIKAKVFPQFPGVIRGANGIQVTRSGSVVTISPDADLEEAIAAVAGVDQAIEEVESSLASKANTSDIPAKASQATTLTGTNDTQFTTSVNVKHSVRRHAKGRFVNPLDPAFGATGNGIVDDTTFLQAAIDEATANSYGLYLPGGYAFRITSPLIIDGPMSIVGDGMTNSVLYCTGSFVGSPLHYQINSSSREFEIRDFIIFPASSGVGTHGLHFQLTGASGSMGNFRVSRLHLTGFADYAIHLDNSIANNDGFFTFDIEECFLENGIKGVKVGDSWRIVRNQCYGAKNLWFSGVAGARQGEIISNNVTTSGGALHLESIYGTVVAKNQLEHPGNSNYTGSTDSHIYIGGDAHDIEFWHNTMTPSVGTGTKPSTMLLMNGTAYNVHFFGRNELVKGSSYYVNRVNTAGKIEFSEQNVWNSSTLSEANAISYLSLQGTGEVRGTLWYKQPSLSNSWVAFDAGSGVTYRKRMDGFVEVSGRVKNGTLAATIFTLDAGYRPTRTYIFTTGAASSTVCQINVNADGTVLVAAAANTDIPLYFSFPAAS